MTLPGDVMMRRQPTPHDATTSPYFIASSNRIGPGDKTKKSWSDRLKLSGRTTQPSSDMSALSKSMRYAETWLYDGGQFQPSVALCCCPEFLGGTTRSTRHSSAGVCKQCGGARTPWRDTRVGGTVRVASHTRPSLLTTYTPDPYDLMRRNRLESRVRAKSSSPGRLRRSPSPSSAQHPRRSRRDLVWDDADDDMEAGRKSILVCDVNPYQLMKEVVVDSDELSDDMSDNEVVTKEVERVTPARQTKKVDDERVTTTTTTTTPPRSLIPRLTSPKRPQRRRAKKEERIKSILKKEALTFSDPVSCVVTEQAQSSARKKTVQFDENSAVFVKEDESKDTMPPTVRDTAIPVPPAQPITLRRSLSDRHIATGGRQDAGKTVVLFNDTMRLRQLAAQRCDSRHVFSRPRSPPPPPPLIVQCRAEDIPQDTVIDLVEEKVNDVETSIIAVNQKEEFVPPQLPPRHIFPFTKRQIQSINSQRRPRCRPNSCIPTPSSAEATSRIRHRNSDPGPAAAAIHHPPDGVRTIVSVCPDSPDVHRLQIMNDDVPMRTSIIVNGDIPNNKVTISVGGASNQTTWANINNASYLDSSHMIVNAATNHITIPVSPEPVYNTRSTIMIADHTALIVDRTTGKRLDGDHEYEVLEMLMDPVEAVKRHLVPHVCGKVNPDGGVNLVSTSAMERLNSLLDEQKGYAESSPESSLTSSADKSESGEENNAISVHYFQADCLPHFVLNDVLHDDDDVKAYDDAENIYESIKDPIYEEIGLPDTPPPLPSSPPPSLDPLTSRSIFEGASKYDILNYLVDAKERGYVEDYGEGKGVVLTSLSELSDCSDETDKDKDKDVRKSSDVERNDSGVGSETSKSSRSRWQTVREDQANLCEDCDQIVETQVSDGGVMFAPLVCRKCAKKRCERKDTIAEIVETEEKYGRDLRIMLEEFYRPMLVAGLLTLEQLAAIFLNVQELVDNNSQLAEKLRDALDIAVEQGDEDLLTVNIGAIFIQAAPMLHAFESYCTRQGGASLLLANLEKEKELLRIFLRVSQMENAVLRRMNLNSFLMVPVQRVTKYPLLLARLYKVTPAHHEARELLKQAQNKIELHLEHMNSVAKDIGTTKLWRRISIVNGRRSSSEIDMINIKLRKLAVDVLEWNHDEVRFAMEGRLLYTNPTDNNWRKGRTIKLNPISALLVTYGKDIEEFRPEHELLLFPTKRTGVKEATLLLVKEKCGRYSLLRDPLYLDKCIVCCETDWEDYFEVQELQSKDTFIFKAEDSERTRTWYRQLQYHSQGHGAWRRRRNALANIMINGMLARS